MPIKNEIFLFPEGAPGSEKADIEEKIFEEMTEDGYLKRIVSGVTKPSIIPHMPEKSNGAAVLVIPGGSYKRQVLNLEGTEIAEWLNSFGITAFVLKHRMPFDGHANTIDVPLQDAQRAMRIIRGNSARFGINPDKIGAMGFSAGGHLTAALGTCHNMTVYDPVDELDLISARPDFIVPAYPAVSADIWRQDGLKFSPREPVVPDLFEKYSVDKLVTENTPEAFIFAADDDPVTPAEHAVSFYLALRKAKVPAELHIFEKGGHGFGMGIKKGRIKNWAPLCRDWMLDILSGR